MNINEYKITLPNYKINIFNRKEIELITKKLIIKINKQYKLNNVIILEIYYNKQYGIIAVIKNYNKSSLNKNKEVKIIIHNDTPFLYKLDYFYILENNLNNQKIYYFKKNFYLEIKNTIPYSKYIKLLENSEIIYKDTLDIVNNGIKIKI